MKRLRGIVESSVQPNTTDVVWLKGNTLKYFSNGKWTEVGGGIKELPDGSITIEKLADDVQEAINNAGGVPIVDSVDKLDLNAERGSLASAAVDTIGEVLFSELYQPTPDEVNPGAGVVDTTNLSSVGGISVIVSDLPAEIQPFEVYLFSKDVDMQGGVGQEVVLVPEVAITVNFSTQEQQELNLFIVNEEGVVTVNEENLNIINNLLSSTAFVYGGVNGDHSYADVFYKSIVGIQKTDLYVKDVESWKLYKDTLSIPPQIEVVNSLNIGGNNKALSAEMGKVLAETVGVIVDSKEELPSTSPVGARASVNINRTIGEKGLDVNKIYEEDKFLHRVDVRGSVSYTPAVTAFTMELEAEDGTQLIIKIGPPYNYSSSRWGALVWGFSDNMPNSGSNRSQTLCEYASLTAGYTVLDVNTETLSNLNNELSSKNYRVVSAYSIGSYGVAVPNVFLYTYAAEVQKFTELYVRNEAGWEEYDKATKDKVATLETKVAELEAKIQELLQS